MKSFDETRALSDDALRAQLAADDAVARVWAVWALALRIGADAIVAHGAGEPSAGVRRAIAVVMAGHGELDLLVALAQHDPDAYVRATAMQLVMRMCEAGRVPWTVVREALAREEATVRAAMIAIAPEELRPEVLVRLHDEDASVRREAFETIARLGGDERELCARLEAAMPNDRAVFLRHWQRACEVPAIVAALASASWPVREQAVRMFDLRGWTAIAPIVDQYLLRTLVSDRRVAASEIPFGVLLDHAAEQLRELERRLDLPIDPAIAARLPQVAQRLEEEARANAAFGAQIAVSGDEEDLEEASWYSDRSEELLRLRDRLLAKR